MLNRKMLAIIKRELNEKLMSKTFIVMTFMVPVLMLVFMGLPSLLMLYKGDKGSHVEIVVETESLKKRLQDSFAKLDFVKDSTYKLNFMVFSGDSLNDYIQKKKPEILSRRLNAVIFIPSKALEDKRIEYYSDTPANRTIPDKLGGPINEVLIEHYFSAKDLSQNDIGFIRKNIDIASFKVSEKEDIHKQGLGNAIIAFVLTFLIYINLAFSGPMTMQSILNEKGGKIVEVILSSVSSRELMTGKIIGVTITSIAQMVIWMLPVLALISTSWFALPEKLTFDMSYGHLSYFFINYLLAVLIYQGLFAAVGSIFENSQESQSAMMPVMMLLIIPFFIAISMMQNPDNMIAIISSFVPFATLMVMPVRFSLVDVPLWQLAISFLINIGTILAIFPVAGKIYSMGILRVGKKPTWMEVFRWLKYGH